MSSCTRNTWNIIIECSRSSITKYLIKILMKLKNPLIFADLSNVIKYTSNHLTNWDYQYIYPSIINRANCSWKYYCLNSVVGEEKWISSKRQQYQTMLISPCLQNKISQVCFSCWYYRLCHQSHWKTLQTLYYSDTQNQMFCKCNSCTQINDSYEQYDTSLNTKGRKRIFIAPKSILWASVWWWTPKKEKE